MNQKIAFAFNLFFLALALLVFIDRIDHYPTLSFWGALALVLLCSTFVITPLLLKKKARLR